MGKLDEKKAKVSIKLALTRIRLQREKTDNLVKQSRREVADFIRQGKIENARVKVEAMIKADLKLEAFEILGFLVDQLSSKLGIMAKEKECPADLKEAVCTIIFAAPRTTVTELNDLRSMFLTKYGKNFVQEAMSNKDNCVNGRVFHKLSVQIPENFLIYQYMQEIANAYSIDWKAPVTEISTGPAPSDMASIGPIHEESSQQRPTETGPPVSSQSSMNFPSPPRGNDLSFPSPPSSHFPSVPSGGGNMPSFPSVPSGGGNVPSFPSVPSGGGNVPSFPSVPSGGTNPASSFPSVPSSGSSEPDIPTFDPSNFANSSFSGMPNKPSFPSVPSTGSSNTPSFPSVPSGPSKNDTLNFPSVPSTGSSNTLSFPSVPSGPSKNDTLNFPSVPSSGGGADDFEDLTARFNKLKKRD